jgi:acyl-CoA thioester hydrolase
MGEVFEKQFVAGWGNVDLNGHLGNTSYLDFAATTRIAFFAEHGFPPIEFMRLQFGPVVKSESIEYFREIMLLGGCRVDVRCSGLSADGSRFRFTNSCYRDDGILAARIQTTAGWLSFSERRLIAPPEDLLAIINRLDRTDEFEVLNSSIKKR